MMLLNNVWVWMCVHGMEEHEAEESARWIAFYEENEAKKNAMLEERQAKRKAKMEEQRLKAVKEANKKAELEESKLQEHQKHQQELLQKLNRETDEQKRRNLKVGLEYSGRLLKERIEETGDEQTKKKLDRWLNVEYTQLLETAIGTAIHRSKYLNKLERRKKDRGHSGSE
eukprot:scaffold37406_cov144-Skeletonema_dohrnii-CCMP3373.AAC.1